MTHDELKKNSTEAEERLEHLKKYLNIDENIRKKSEIEKEMAAPNFWDNREEAQKKMEILSSAKGIIENYQNLVDKVEDFCAFAELTIEENDETMLKEADSLWEKLSNALNKAELMSFLSGKYDKNNAYLTIHAGAGGTESCDWASMLFRMYRRWIERRGWNEEIEDFLPGDEAGIKSVTMYIKGNLAYGYAKAESGVHRLVRISPFDSNSRRHTSFASVEVMPEISDEDFVIEIEEKDLRMDTFRSSGAGGQHVNKTDSAVRLTHIPTGLVASCQSDRSQHKNRSKALKMLKSKLFAVKEEERRKETENISGEKTEMGWGNQIRSYVLHPYQMVKDLRTNTETGNTSAVLDGDIEVFIDAWLRTRKN
ncbi:MAG: peptide chain release factor 2 [Victivallales bacterium]|nr:peptide chain release factor 2 [Victivallales bacterium]